MSREDLTLVLSILAILGVILQTVANAFFSFRQSAAERREARQKEVRDHLSTILRDLIELRASLQYLQARSIDGKLTSAVEREQSYGKAYALILSIPDSAIRRQAQAIMVEQWDGTGKNPKLSAIDEAIEALSDILALHQLRL